MDVMDKAMELGTLIAESQEMQAFKKAEAAMEQDDKAKSLMNDYKQLQIEMVRAAKENREKTVLDDLKQRLLSKQEELNGCEVTKSFLDSKAAFDKLMKNINNVIIFAITGEEPCSPKKCSSCGGGCK